MEADLLGDLARRRKQTDEQLAEMVSADTIEVVLAFTPGLDQSRNAEQSEMVADGGLTLAESIAEIRDVQLVVLRQEEKNAEPGLVAKQLEDLSKFAYGLLGDLRHDIKGAGRPRAALLNRFA